MCEKLHGQVVYHMIEPAAGMFLASCHRRPQRYLTSRGEALKDQPVGREEATINCCSRREEQMGEVYSNTAR